MVVGGIGRVEGEEEGFVGVGKLGRGPRRVSKRSPAIVCPIKMINTLESGEGFTNSHLKITV